jgi:NADH-quinone oxidoreductase subunit H
MTPHLFFSYFLYIHTIPVQFWYIDALRIVLRCLIPLFAVLLAVPPLVWYERRLLGWMQQRQGPNRVGPFGLLQTIADGVKLLFKEDMNPLNVDKTLFVLAPIIFLIPTLVTPVVIPWGPSRNWGAGAPGVSVGVLYLLAWGSLAVYGIVLAGWSSNNKYSLLGGLRSSAQMISYELAMGLAILTVVLMTGSLGLQDVVDKQSYFSTGLPAWNVFKFFPMGFIATLLYIISMLAETNRAPFDLPEAETELVAGYHTEYTSMKFATFFMGEYGNMIVTSAICATLFFGGYNAPIAWLNQLPPFMVDLYANWHAEWLTNLVNSLIGPVWLTLKVWAGVYFFIWIRATLPRLRYDMLMKFGWQGLLPIALLNILLVAVSICLGYGIGVVAWVVLFGILLVAFASSARSIIFTTNTRRDSSIRLFSSAQPFSSVPQNPGVGAQTLPPDAPVGGFDIPTTDREADEMYAALGKKG